MALEITADRAEPAAAKKRERAAKPRSGRGRSISNKERMFFTEQLALLIETGMPVHQALAVIQGQLSNPALAAVVADLRELLAGGNSFSHALRQHPEVFSTTYVNLVAASEGGGFMHEVLTQLLQMEEKREELRSTLIAAFTYPAFLVSFSLLVVIFVLVFVFPKFGDLFAAIRDELPISTLVLLTVSDFLRAHWVVVLAATAGGGVLLQRWLISASGRRIVDRAKLRAPVFSTIFVQLYLVQSLRVLSLSLGNGVPVVDALRACRDVVDNGIFRNVIRFVETRVTEGGKIGEGFAESAYVPDLAKQMISTAEEAGNLALVTDRMAQFYQRELNKKLERLAKIIEPVMLLVMGLVVGVIVSSLILPIFKLSRAVG